VDLSSQLAVNYKRPGLLGDASGIIDEGERLASAVMPRNAGITAP